MSLQLSGAEGMRKRGLDAYLALRRRSGGCLMICGWEGEHESVRRRRSLGHRRLRAGGAVPLGTAAGRSWEKGRFEGPYLRDELLGMGVFVETLETSHTWSRLDELYQAVGGALKDVLGQQSIVMCHLSHAYPDGASLYFTFLARARAGAEIEQWREAKSGRLRRDRHDRWHDHPPPRGRPRPRPLHDRRDRRARASTHCAPSRPASIRRGS